MINTELTLDQLQAVSGGGKEERQARKAARKAARAEKKCLRKWEKGPGSDGTWIEDGNPNANPGTCTTTYDF